MYNSLICINFRAPERLKAVKYSIYLWINYFLLKLPTEMSLSMVQMMLVLVDMLMRALSDPYRLFSVQRTKIVS